MVRLNILQTSNQNNKLLLEISFNKYRNIDLIMFSIFLFICEVTSMLVKNSAINDIYFTFSVFILALTIFRWNWWGVIPIVIGYCGSAIVESIYLNTPILIAILNNVIANLFGILLVLVFYINNDQQKVKQIIKNNILLLIMYFIIPFILIGIGKGVVGLIIGEGSFVKNFLYYIFNYQILSIFASILLGVFLSKHQSLMVDQKQYIREIQEKKEKL